MLKRAGHAIVNVGARLRCLRSCGWLPNTAASNLLAFVMPSSHLVKIERFAPISERHHEEGSTQLTCCCTSRSCMLRKFVHVLLQLQAQLSLIVVLTCRASATVMICND
ncbi:hypothetical protein MRB53_040422 [Persea americana]|nr:hypothetical protein MRB53_040422 [Persea americana]